MSANALLPGVTCVLGLISAGAVLRRFAARRQAQYAVWSLGLLWYALATGCEALAAFAGWSPGIYRLWYVTGAIGVAAYLGAGTIYLHRADSSFGSLTIVCLLIGCIPALATRHAAIGLAGLAAATLLTLVVSTRRDAFAHVAFGVLLVASTAATVVVASAPIDISMLPRTPDEVVSGQGFDAEIRAMTPAFNISGAAVLVLGAGLSALRFWRQRGAPRRVVSNVLIAVGAFVPSLASGLTRFGITSVFFLGELIGLACLVAGFFLSVRAAPSSSGYGPPPTS